MPTWQDARIFVCAVTQYSMSSGKFEAQHIEELAQQSFQTFVNLFGMPNDGTALADLSAAPAAKPGFQYVKPLAAAPTAPPQGGEPGDAEGKPFRFWATDKIRLGKKASPIGGKAWGEVTWAEAHRSAAGGNKATLGYLDFLCGLEDKDPQYAKGNATIRARAAAILAASASSAPIPDADQVPF